MIEYKNGLEYKNRFWGLIIDRIGNVGWGKIKDRVPITLFNEVRYQVEKQVETMTIIWDQACDRVTDRINR